ncbi:MAG: hypothetical protein QOE03_3256, partial [Micromonosporaceae bacterium]|nr:hypothetical protein [Micromonosporaceae bacterium]
QGNLHTRLAKTNHFATPIMNKN